MVASGCPLNSTGRYAPSPTGELHLGNLRTALLAWLFARSAGGRLLLRVEDLDVGRVREAYVAEQLDDLRAIGLDWDGEVVRQSRRTALYAGALARLESDGRVFRCFCSRREVREAASAQHGELPEGFYPGTCLALGAAESQRRADAGEEYALRLRAGGAEVTVRDRLHGERTDVVDEMQEAVVQCLDCMHDQPHLGFADGRVQPIQDRWERMVAGTPWVASCTVTVDADEVETCSGPEAGDALSYAAFGDHGTREFFTHVRHGFWSRSAIASGAIAAGVRPTRSSWMASSLGMAPPGEAVAAADHVPGAFRARAAAHASRPC